MHIRKARPDDCFALSALLAELGYSGTEHVIEARLAQLCTHPDEILLVAGRRCWDFCRCILSRSWRWQVISPVSAIFALRKVNAVKAAASSCCPTLSSWRGSEAVIVWRCTVTLRGLRPISFTHVKAMWSHRAII